MDVSVEVDWSKIRSEWRRTGYEGGFWLMLAPGGVDPHPLADDVTAAVLAADGAADAAGYDGEVQGGEGLALAKGVVVPMVRTGGEASLRLWLDAFAEALAGGGWSGRVGVARSHRYPPRWVEANRGAIAMSAFTAATTDGGPERDHRGRMRWAVPPEATTRLLTGYGEWSVRRPGVAAAFLGIFCVKIDNQSPAVRAAALTLAEMLQEEAVGLISSAHRPSGRFTVSSFDPHGLSTHAHTDPGVPWRSRLEQATAALLVAPDLLDLAFVRLGFYSAPGWQSIQSLTPGLPPHPRSWWLSHRGQFHTTSPDAHAVQVLTGAHLDRAHDLSSWDVREVASDRYLVSARDPEPWFERGRPDPDVHRAARADFGDMLRWRTVESDA